MLRSAPTSLYVFFRTAYIQIFGTLKHLSLSPDTMPEHESTGRGHISCREFYCMRRTSTLKRYLQRTPMNSAGQEDPLFVGNCFNQRSGRCQEANTKMKRLAPKILSESFILTCLCAANYKARGIYKTIHTYRRLRRPHVFETRLASILRNPLSFHFADTCHDQPCSSQLHDIVGS